MAGCFILNTSINFMFTHSNLNPNFYKCFINTHVGTTKYLAKRKSTAKQNWSTLQSRKIPTSSRGQGYNWQQGPVVYEPLTFEQQKNFNRTFQRLVFKVAPYSFRSVSRKFCPRARLVVLHATRVVDVARMAGFLKFAVSTNIFMRQNVVIYTCGLSWDCRMIARGNWNPDFCDVA
jgi:hypothetical protein